MSAAWPDDLPVDDCDGTSDADLGAPGIDCNGGVSWGVFGWQLRLSLAAWIFLIGLCSIAGPLWHRIGAAENLLLRKWVGQVADELPFEPRADAWLRLAQFTASLSTVVLWVIKTYERGVPFAVAATDAACCVVFAVHLVWSLLRHGFSTSYALDWEVMVDCFTVPPLLFERFGGGPAALGAATTAAATAANPSAVATAWVSLAFLRVLRVHSAFGQLAAAGVLAEYLTEMSVALVMLLLKSVALTVIVSATMFILEARLSDAPGGRASRIGLPPYIHGSARQQGLIAFIHSRLKVLRRAHLRAVDARRSATRRSSPTNSSLPIWATSRASPPPRLAVMMSSFLLS